MQKKVALVTGSYRGLGLETVKQLAEMQFHAIISGRRLDIGKAETHALIQKGLHVSYLDLDVTSGSSISAASKWVEEKFGRLDVLVNNAGIHYDMGHPSVNPDWKIVEEATQINFLGAWRAAVGLLPLLKKSPAGRIVNVSSGAGSLHDVTPGTPAYSASKAALNMLTIQLASELKSSGIKVNSVCPGWVRTEMGGPQAPRSVEEGAKGIVWAATLDANGPTGGFFRDGKPIAW
jgi:NAD(P)-dependent dehydrogenase (short-subunit alcohol dehydrogenase family)